MESKLNQLKKEMEEGKKRAITEMTITLEAAQRKINTQKAR